MDFWMTVVIVFLLCAVINLPYFVMELREDQRKKQKRNPAPVQPQKPESQREEEQNPQPPVTGKCGDNMTWRKEGDVLYFEGTGELKTYWEKWCEIQDGFPYGIQKVVIRPGCTAIGRDVFGRGCESITENWTNLVSVEIPETVTTIGDCAFWGCDELQSIRLPSGLVEIGVSAFEDCTGLTHIEIPDQVTVIADSAFSDCKSLCSVTLPSGLKKIELGAFSWCRNLTTLVIPDSVTEIGKDAFKEVPRIIYNGPARSDDNWGALRWEKKPENQPAEGKKYTAACYRQMRR